MPYHDATGPRGGGHMTGRGHGHCSVGRNQASGYKCGDGHHRRRGCGRGYGGRADWDANLSGTDSERLTREKHYLEKRLAAIEEQLGED